MGLAVMQLWHFCKKALRIVTHYDNFVISGCATATAIKSEKRSIPYSL
jgi:hypothetical protein